MFRSHEPARPRPVRVAVIGSGFSGLAMAIALQHAGLDEGLTIFERNSDIGGTWRDNTYPGCACDIPSHLYSLSAVPNPDWSRAYSPQAEIQDYLLRTVERYGLRKRCRFDTEIVAQEWDADRAVWTLTSATGEVWEAEVVVNAIGALKDPAHPRVPGRETFAGPSFHSARWDHDVDLTGADVAVVGTGASAVQIVPEIADRAAGVTVYQRTAPWVVPRLDRRFTAVEKLAFRHVPGLQQAYRSSIYWRQEILWPIFEGTGQGLVEGIFGVYLRTQVRDRELRRKVTPRFAFGCKRLLKSSDWYATLCRADVSVETDAIAEIVADGLVMADGRRHVHDVIIYGTGFDVHNALGPMTVLGVDGRQLEKEWGRRQGAYLGTALAGFPNQFVLLGPNTGLGHNSVVVMIEAQVDYVLQAVELLAAGEADWLMPTDAAQQAFLDEVDARHRDLVWASGCGSWYLDDDGVNDTLWPGSSRSFVDRMRRFDVERYELGRRTVPVGAAAR